MVRKGMKALAYRWRNYAGYLRSNTQWRGPRYLRRACNALKQVGESLEIVFDNGQRVIVTVKNPPYGKRA